MNREEFERWIKEFAPAAAAVRKAGSKPGWFPFEYIAATGGMIVKGGVLREVTRGPNKGQLTSRDCAVDEVVVSEDDIRKEERRIAKARAKAEEHAVALARQRAARVRFKTALAIANKELFDKP